MRTVSLLFHDVYAADPRESGFASDAADRYKLLGPGSSTRSLPVWRRCVPTRRCRLGRYRRSVPEA